MTKRGLLILLFITSFIYLNAQNKDTVINNTNVIILGVKYFDDPVVFWPSESKHTLWITDSSGFLKHGIELSAFTERSNLDSLKYNTNNIQYAVFNPDYYLYLEFIFSGFVKDYIIPYITCSEYISILNESYPKYCSNSLCDLVQNGEWEYDRNYQFVRLNYHKFLILLVSASLYNQYMLGTNPPKCRFCGDNVEQGLYFKIAIPIVDDNYTFPKHKDKKNRKDKEINSGINSGYD